MKSSARTVSEYKHAQQQHNNRPTTMQYIVTSKFASITTSERGQLVSSVHRYVSNSQFGNIIQNIDINNARSDPVSRRSPGNLYFVCNQLSAFNGIPDMLTEVHMWLNSV